MAAVQRVAILGGGLSALATAFHLTKAPDWREKYDVTVYQQGWRLGGKCASGRDLREGYGSRIYEHGLHLFGGFYDYSFSLLKQAYEELARPVGHPNRHYLDAFIGVDQITLMDRIVAPGGKVTFEPWYINFEMTTENPGEAIAPASVQHMIVGIVRLLGAFDPAVGPAALAVPPADSGHPLLSALDRLIKLGAQTALDIVGPVVDLAVQDLQSYLRRLQPAAPSAAEAQTFGRLQTSIFLAQTIIHGIVFDDVLTKGFNHLDDLELMDWLKKHALTVALSFPAFWPDPVAAADALVQSPIVRGSYDYVFGYADGDITRPSQAAGTALRGMLRLSFCFKGHIFYAMRGGMGDVVIAPLYQALAARGVKFEFFSRVQRLVPGETGIDAVEMSQQAKLAGADYQPLIELALPGWPAAATLPCWPSEPLWNQLQDSDGLKGVEFEAPWGPTLGTRTLKRGVDFDTIALGIPIGELRRICADLPTKQPKWRDMLDKLATTRTLALQLWFEQSNEDLGYVAPGRTLTGNEQPFSCWADMTHLVGRETWNGPERPLSIAFFCGQMSGGVATCAAEQDQATAEVVATAKTWLAKNAPRLWPAASAADSGFGLDPAVLLDPASGAGAARFASQYFRANVSPSELYVQYAPGTFPVRLRANESGFDNLFLCGDWTRNGLNAGAAESAVMSGVICARVMGGDLSPIPGESDVW